MVLYFINWNDCFYFPFLKEHYEKFCEKIIMYDNYSSDNSFITAKNLGFEVRFFGQRGQLNDQYYLDVKNHCWKECRGKGIDYVIVCDADEFIIPEELKGTSPIVTGYNMISEYLPHKSILEINTGSYSQEYSKQAIFSPDAIDEINYVHGAHRNYMKGNITTDGHCKLLHYRQIGGVERIIRRHFEYRNRLSSFNKQHKMGFHYNHSDDAKRVEWNDLKSKAIQVF